MHFRRFGAIYLLAFLFLGSWALQLWTEWNEYVNTQFSHGESTVTSDFLYQFGASTFENWQSEFLQLLVQVLITFVFARYIFSRAQEENNEINAKLDRLLYGDGEV